MQARSTPILVVPLLVLAPSARAQTYYRDSPGASDAERIATQMLNDAAARSANRNTYHRPYNPFDAMIEEYEAKQRERAAELAWYAEEAERNRAENERNRAENERYAAERAALDARLREAESISARFNALLELANQSNVSACFQAAAMLEEGTLDHPDIEFHGTTAEETRRQLYERAACLGSDLGYIGLVSAQNGDAPNLHALLAALRSLASPKEQRDHLLQLADRNHLGAMLLLGAWFAGREVTLGPPPRSLTSAKNTRASALKLLERGWNADRHASTWLYARELLTGPTTAEEHALAITVLEEQVARTPAGDPPSAYVLGLEVLRIARGDADFQRAGALLRNAETSDWMPARLALADMHLAGRDGRFQPAAAAALYARIPNHDAWWHAEVHAHLATGWSRWFGVGARKDASAAVEAFSAAKTRAESATWASDAASRRLQSDAQVWSDAAYLESGGHEELLRFVESRLRVEAEAGSTLARVLAARERLGRADTTADEAERLWTELAPVDPIVWATTPPEILTVLDCVVRLRARGARPELEPIARAAAQLDPELAPSEGAALLARLYASSAGPRDVADRGAAPRMFAALLRGAYRNERDVLHAAALVEALQVEPLSRARWNETWLAQFDVANSTVAELAKVSSDALAEPTPERIEALARRCGESLSLRDAAPVDFQTLCASLRLRSAATNDAARDAFERIAALAEGGVWHAQAMLEDFDARYRRSYLARWDAAGFHRDARAAAERSADWRERGHACAPADEGRRFRAIEHAIAHGSERFTIATLQAAADRGVDAALFATLRMKAGSADPRTPEERDEDDAVQANWERICAREGWTPFHATTHLILDQVAEKLTEEQGHVAALALWMRQARRHPELLWKLAMGRAEGNAWLPKYPRAALDAFRAAVEDGRRRASFHDLVTFARLVGTHGVRDDLLTLERALERYGATLDTWRAPTDTPSYQSGYYPDKILAALGDVSMGRCASDPAKPTEDDVARARRYYALALRSGSSDTLKRLTSAPFDADAELQASLGRILIETSTMNAPLALPFLRRASEAGDVSAREELAHWVDAQGAPTPRLAYVEARREYVSLSPNDVATETVGWYRRHGEVDRGWLPQETAELVRRANAGDQVAREVVLQAGLTLPSLIPYTPDAWIANAQENLDEADHVALWLAVDEAPTLWKQARNYYQPDTWEWQRAAGTIGAIAVALAPDTPPDGWSRDQLDALLAIGFEGGHDPSFRMQVERAIERANATTQPARDAIVLAHAARALELDLANAVYLEKILRPHCKDEAGWRALYRSKGLHVDDKGTPSALLLFLRKKVGIHHVAGGAPKHAKDPWLFPHHAGFAYGYAGDKLRHEASSSRDANAIQALGELGYAELDWDDVQLE
ncbi:MAG: hypothetical protein HZA53_11130 [Planctomycetes bacterium]|nr:hypothetical protein [Planctomycetota bacterium]